MSCSRPRTILRASTARLSAAFIGVIRYTTISSLHADGRTRHTDVPRQVPTGVVDVGDGAGDCAIAVRASAAASATPAMWILVGAVVRRRTRLAALGISIAALANARQLHIVEPGLLVGATMDEIKGIARVKFHPGKVEEWKRLTEEAMEIVRTQDTGTLQYEIMNSPAKRPRHHQRQLFSPHCRVVSR